MLLGLSTKKSAEIFRPSLVLYIKVSVGLFGVNLTLRFKGKIEMKEVGAQFLIPPLKSTKKIWHNCKIRHEMVWGVRSLSLSPSLHLQAQLFSHRCDEVFHSASFLALGTIML